VDKNLITVDHIFLSTLKREGFEWYGEGDNMEYLSDVFVKTKSSELEKFKAASTYLHGAAVEAAQFMVQNRKLTEAGIPSNASKLIEYSLQNELDNFFVGRFDFAGGYDGLPIKFLEYNADTCSLMPETSVIQDLHYIQEQKKLHKQPYHQLIEGMAKRFQKIKKKNPNKEPYLLVSDMGHEDDKLNVQIILRAAKQAGFTEVKYAPLSEVIFSETEGIYVEASNGEYHRYDFWYKFIPWDYIAFDEPELMRLLTEIGTRNLAVIMNPAYTMLLQCKSIAKYMYDLYPRSPTLLKTTFHRNDFPQGRYVEKPVFGRMGENISYFDGGASPVETTEGDYGKFSPIFQQLAEFNIDSEEHRYQPSIYFTDAPCGLAIRRQDDLIIDDDAEFVGHTIV